MPDKNSVIHSAASHSGTAETAATAAKQTGANAEDRHVPVRGYMRAMIKVDAPVLFLLR